MQKAFQWLVLLIVIGTIGCGISYALAKYQAENMMDKICTDIFIQNFIA